MDNEAEADAVLTGSQNPPRMTPSGVLELWKGDQLSSVLHVMQSAPIDALDYQ